MFIGGVTPGAVMVHGSSCVATVSLSLFQVGHDLFHVTNAVLDQTFNIEPFSYIFRYSQTFRSEFMLAF